ncbi:hypothetical protein D3C81_545060 [compost metagenome]
MHHAFTLAFVILDQQDAFHFLCELRFELAEHFFQLLARARLGGVADGAQLHGFLHLVIAGHDVHGNMAGQRVFLELLQDQQAGTVRQAHVEQDGVGQEFFSQAQAFLGAMRHQAAVLHFVRQVEQDAGKRRLILNHQHGTLAASGGGRAVAVILEGGQGHGLGGGRCFRHGSGGRRGMCGRFRR